ncbi:MAG: Ig-like domain-containing protein, partial [Ruminococcus sp.]|nr:Ig-like domain-containing protein [Ruminococcus sp.]
MYDGTVVTADDYGEYSYKGKEIPVFFSDDQSEENVWDEGAHTATVSVWGTTATFTVNVEATPAVSLTINDVTIIEGTHCSETGRYTYRPSFTVTLKDGTVLESDDDYNAVYYNDEYYSLDTEDDQSTNPWELGTHTATGSVMGLTAEFNVEIVETPVVSVKTEPIKLIENASGELDRDYDEETDTTDDEYFRYYSYPVNYTVTLKDGTVLESDEDGDVFYNGEYYSVTDINDNQSYSTPWTAGNTYTCTASVLGFTFDYEAIVEGSPVKSVEVGDMTLIDGYDNYTERDEDNNAWNYYEYYTELPVKVTLKNGEVLEGDDGGILYKGENFYLSYFKDDQSSTNQWKPGNSYTMTAYILGFETTIKVNVIANPIASVNVNPLEIKALDEDYGYFREYYNQSGNLVGEYFYYSELAPADYTVTMKDGGVLKSDDEGYIYYAGRYFKLWYDDESTDQSYQHQWTVGNTYTVSGRVMGYTANYKVNIVSEYTPAAATTITLKAAKTKITVGSSTTVTAKVNNPVGATTFKSSNTKVAAVNAAGKVTGKKAGTVTITAANNGKVATVKITVVKKGNTLKVKAKTLTANSKKKTTFA